jgi:LuxR family transcriptional regulator
METLSPPNLIERLVPGFAEWSDRVREIAPAGYTLALNIRFLHPEIVHSTYPEEWVDYYLKNDFAVRDPILLWTSYNSGNSRWSDIGLPAKVPFARRVLELAADHGLRFGAIFVVRNSEAQNRKCFLSVGRSDRELTDEEIAKVGVLFREMLDRMHVSSGLTTAEVEVLRLLARGLTQNEIAEDLGIGRDAIKKRIERARVVLGAKNAAHAIAIAIQRQLFRVDQV